MAAKVKPIQATPTLSGDDARNIIRQVSIAPSKAAIEKIKKKHSMIKLAAHR